MGLPARPNPLFPLNNLVISNRIWRRHWAKGMLRTRVLSRSEWIILRVFLFHGRAVWSFSTLAQLRISPVSSSSGTAMSFRTRTVSMRRRRIRLQRNPGGGSLRTVFRVREPRKRRIGIGFPQQSLTASGLGRAGAATIECDGSLRFDSRLLRKGMWLGNDG